MSDKANINDTIKRSTILGILIGVLFLVLLLRILIIQTVKYEIYQSKVISQITTETTVTAKRGTIYDRNGRVLATTATSYNLVISPSSIAEAQERREDNTKTQAEMIAAGISAILGEECGEKIINDAEKYKNTLYRKVYDKISDDEIKARILNFINDNGLANQVYFEAINVRYYPYGTLACHVIGFCNYDGMGVCGLEAYYNDVLSGTDGRVVTARDAYGEEMDYDYESYVAAIDGCDIYTTIDVEIQRALDEQCEQSLINTGARERTCGIVMDPETGGILAMSTAPAFDLNDPQTLIEYYQKQLDAYVIEKNLLDANGNADVTNADYIEKLGELKYKMWQNKAITDEFIPGSTFKIITSAISLDNKIVTDVYRTDSAKFNCVIIDGTNLGGSNESGALMHCHSLHGSQSFAQGLMNSCNVVFIKLGLLIGSDRFYNGFDNFGYLSKTGIDLGGELGNTTHSQEALLNQVNLATTAFGQNFTVTGIQHITGVNAVVNGGTLLEPYVVAKVADTNGNTIYAHDREELRRVATEATCNTLAEILEECVSGGYGGKNCYVPGYRVAAKTGTSEKVGKDKALRIGSVMAFAPAENPVVTAFLMCDEPDPTYGSTYGSTVAAPYMQALMAEILPYLDVEASYKESEREELVTQVYSFVGWSVETIKNYITEWYGLTEDDYEIIGGGEYVYSQLPEGGTTVKKDGMKIYLYTSNNAQTTETVTVPNVVGLPAAGANAAMVNRGFNVMMIGENYYDAATTTVVTAQLPRAGEKVPKGTVIKLYFDGGEEDVIDEEGIIAAG